MLENTFADLAFDGETEENMGGARLVKYAPVPRFTALPPGIQGHVIGTPTWAGTLQWNTLTATEDTASFDEDEERRDGGPFWRNRFTAVVAGDTGDRRMTMDSLARVPVIAEVLDNNGVLRRMGELLDPAYITVSHTTGGGAAARNQWSVEITWGSDRACFIVDPTFIPSPPPEEEGSDSDDTGVTDSETES